MHFDDDNDDLYLHVYHHSSHSSYQLNFIALCKLEDFLFQCDNAHSRRREITTSVAKKRKSFYACQGEMTFNAHKKYFLLFLFSA
jgi:hypothetical protein